MRRGEILLSLQREREWNERLKVMKAVHHIPGKELRLLNVPLGNEVRTPFCVAGLEQVGV